MKMARNQGQGKQNKRQSNVLFGRNYVQQYCKASWDQVCEDHPDDALKIVSETSQTVGQNLNNNGLVLTVHECKKKINELVTNGDISQVCADAVNMVLDELKIEVAREEKEKKDKATQSKRLTSVQKMNSPMAILEAITSIEHNIESAYYTRLYSDRINDLINSVEEDKRAVFHENCIILHNDTNPNSEISKLAVILVTFCHIDNDIDRMERFKNSQLFVKGGLI